MVHKSFVKIFFSFRVSISGSRRSKSGKDRRAFSILSRVSICTAIPSTSSSEASGEIFVLHSDSDVLFVSAVNLRKCRTKTPGKKGPDVSGCSPPWHRGRGACQRSSGRPQPYPSVCVVWERAPMFDALISQGRMSLGARSFICTRSRILSVPCI